MDEESFAVHEEQRGELPILRVQGAVDVYTAPNLQEAVRTALSPSFQSLAIDLSRVGFLDSSGLQVLISAKKRTAERGGELYVLGTPEPVLRVFHLVGFERVLTLCSEKDLPALEDSPASPGG